MGFGVRVKSVEAPGTPRGVLSGHQKERNGPFDSGTRTPDE